MEIEADRAKVENKDLMTEISSREIVSRSLITEQQESYNALRTLRIEQEVRDAAAKIQEQQMLAMKKKTLYQKKYVIFLYIYRCCC